MNGILALLLTEKRQPKPPPIPDPPPPEEEFGVTFSDEELTAWRRRWNNTDGEGKYLVLGDVKQYSPDDKARIIAMANELVGNPLIESYSGPKTKHATGYAMQDESDTNPKDQGARTMCAAFAGLITGNTTYINAAKNAILGAIRNPVLNFADPTKWKPLVLFDVNPGFVVAEMITRFCVAYDYLEDYFTASQKSEFLNWLDPVANFFSLDLNAPLNSRFSGRQEFLNGTQSSYTMSNTSWLAYASPATLTHDNGLNVPNIGRFYNNRKMHCAHAILISALLLDKYGNSTQKAKAAYYIKVVKTFIKEFIIYGLMGFVHQGKTYALYADMYRGHNNTFKPQGFAYSVSIIGAKVLIIDMLARKGDFELLNFSTTQTIYQGSTPIIQGQRSTRIAIRTYADMYNGSLVLTNGGEVVNGHHVQRNWYSLYDHAFAVLNRYWKDDVLKQTYLRTSRPWPSPSLKLADGRFTYMGSAKTRPGVMFMYADFGE